MRSPDRNTVVFYLAGWVLGACSIGIAMSLDIIASQGLPTSFHEMLVVLVYVAYGTLFLGAPFLVFGTYLLRCTTSALNSAAPLLWALIGAILGPPLVFGSWWVFEKISRPTNSHDALRKIAGFLTIGPVLLVENHTWWLVIPAGAAASFALCYVEHALALRRHAPPNA